MFFGESSTPLCSATNVVATQGTCPMCPPFPSRAASGVGTYSLTSFSMSSVLTNLSMTFFEPSNLYNNDLVNQVLLNLQQWIVVNRKLHNVKVFFNNVEQHNVYFNSCCNQINELLQHCKAVRAKRTMFVLAKTILRPTCAETAHATSTIHDVHAKSDSHMKDSFFIWHWSKTLFAWTSTQFITSLPTKWTGNRWNHQNPWFLISLDLIITRESGCSDDLHKWL